jgi:hypothetical protein
MGHRLLSVERASKHSTRCQSRDALTPIFELFDFGFKDPDPGVSFVQQFAQCANRINCVCPRCRTAASLDTYPTIDLLCSPIGCLNYLELIHAQTSPMTPDSP